MAYSIKNLKINKLSVVGAGQIGPAAGRGSTTAEGDADQPAG